MNAIPSGIRCPSCRGPLRPAVLACDACGVRVEGHFQGNEFSALGAEDLHLLRIFVRTEGSIREMESALGLSYPTIKTRLADLRARLNLGSEAPAPPPAPLPVSPVPEPPVPSAGPADPSQVLHDLESGKLSVEEAVRRIRKLS